MLAGSCANAVSLLAADPMPACALWCVCNVLKEPSTSTTCNACCMDGNQVKSCLRLTHPTTTDGALLLQSVRSLGWSPGRCSQPVCTQSTHQVGHLNGSDSCLSTLVANLATSTVKRLQGNKAASGDVQSNIQSDQQWRGGTVLTHVVGC